MSTGDWIVVAVVVVLLALALGGRAANARHRRRTAGRFSASLAAVDRALADALAQDRGWERAGIEAAARRELAERLPGEQLAELTLVQVIDRPGTDDDQAVFEVLTTGGARRRLTLGRRGGDWYAASLD